MGSRKQCTQINESPDPKWDSSMQFLVKDIQDDILCVTVFNQGHYSPDGNGYILFCTINFFLRITVDKIVLWILFMKCYTFIKIQIYF